MRHFLLLLTIVLCTSPAWGQQGINALVLDLDGKPLEYCNVVGYTKDSVFMRGTITDSLGRFNISNVDSLFYLRFSSLGYATQDVPVLNFPAQVRMAPENIAVDGVVVEGRRPRLTMERGKLKMNVRGTILSERPHVGKVLSQIPGLTAESNGEASLIGGGTLVTFIDGRKVLSSDELQALDPKDIESITLDRAPGTRYGSGVRAVLNIRTVHRFDQISVLARSWADFNHLVSYGGSAQVGYYTKNTKFLFYIWHRNDRELKTELMDAKSAPFKQLLVRRIDTTHYLKNYARVQMDVLPNEKLSTGVRYNFSWNRETTSDLTRTQFNPGHAAWERVDATGDVRGNSPSHHISGYVTYKPTKDWEIELNADVFARDMRRRQLTHERSAAVNRDINWKTDAHYLLWQLSPRVSYSFTKEQALEAGADINHITGDRQQYKENRMSVDGRNGEALYAAYTNYTYALSEKWNLSAGLRYEHAASRLSDARVPANDVSRTYDNLFFSGKVSGQIGNAMHVFDVSSGTQRPALEDLSNNSYYSSRFILQESNPKLIPAKIYRANYAFNYGPIFAGLSYRYTRDHIDHLIHQNPNDPDGYVFAKANFKHHHSGQAMLGMQMSLAKWYTIDISGLAQLERIDGKQYGLALKARPLYYGKISQTFSFSWVNFEIEYAYQSPLTAGTFEAREQHTLEASVWRSFFKDRLYVYIEASNILAARDVAYTRVGGLSLLHDDYRDTRKIKLFIRYRFNKATSKNRTSAASESIDRL